MLDERSSTSSAPGSARPPHSASGERTEQAIGLFGDPIPQPPAHRPRPAKRKRIRDAHMRHERELHLAGFVRVAGLDEVGRGSLAGPVVAAAVVLPERHRIKGIRDSKVVPRVRRERLYELILDRAEAVGVGCVEVETIDRINILQATKLAMRQALEHLADPPDHLLIDALSLRDVDLPQRPIIDGDAISASIAAASIVAKVTRDRICDEFDLRYPAYGFARNKGYGTRRHVDALLTEGACEWHRRSFAPIRWLVAGMQLPLDLGIDLVDENDVDLD